MTLPSGSRIGSYEIRSLVGEGGMGVVYRAHDTRLGREVALKVLPEALTGDPERLARLEREAKLLASLNHPAVASVHAPRVSISGSSTSRATPSRVPSSTPRTPSGGGRFSPDGRWVAFVSNESGTSQVYVAPVDDPGARRAVSTAGGIAPRWRRSDGAELYYLGPLWTVMAVDVRASPTWRLGEPRALFELDGPVYAASFDVSPDGELFVVNQVIEDATRAPIQVRLNWPAALAFDLTDGPAAP